MTMNLWKTYCYTNGKINEKSDQELDQIIIRINFEQR